MNNHNNMEEKLHNLNKNIHWSPRRQQRVRRKIVDKMNRDKHPFQSFFKRWLIPAFSVLLFAAIITTLALSEFTGQKTADDSDPSGQSGEHSTSIITGNDHEDMYDENSRSNSDSEDEPDNTPTQNGNNDPSTGNEQANESSKTHPNDTDNQESSLTQDEILHAITKQINTDLDIQLPSELPVNDGYHLTATTSADATNYKVVFYEHTEPIPINNDLLFSDENPAKIIARLKVDQYDSQTKADEEIGHKNFSESGGEEVDLGPDTTGYQDGAAGSVFTSWNVGRWALSVGTSTQHSENGLTYAKNTVSYLTKQALPIPKPHGFAHLNQENGNSRIKWQKGKKVYTIDQTNDPDIALNIAVQFK